VAFLVLGAYWSGADWAFRSVSWIFVAALFADVVVGTRRGDFPPPATERTSRMFTWPWLFVQAALIVTGLHAIAHAPAMHTLVVTAIAVGATGGMFGIPVAHELMHRRNRVDRFLAEMLMTLFSYAHFCIEHVEGHHRNVGTPADPATARYAESLYAFLPRTVFGGFASALRLESARLRKRNRPIVSPYNRMLRYALIQCGLYVAVGVAFGRWGVAFFALQGAISILLIETLNYIEHYGLTRQEGVDYQHSWDAGHAVSGWFLFNVTRHSDHHVHPNKHYLSLEGRAEAPQLPAGYFSLFVLALFPPLWRKVIDPRLSKNSELSGKGAS
jgi:alkane 1-monooxygenase